MANPVKSARVSRSNGKSFDPFSTLTVRVGPTDHCKTFVVHESFITARSEFFRRAMNGKWIESETRTINLVDDDPDTFALYINHVYTNELPTVTLNEDELKTTNFSELSRHVITEQLTLSKLYLLGEKIQDSLAKDAALTAILHLSSVRSPDRRGILPGSSVIELIYNGTPENSPARRLIADLWSNADTDTLLRVRSVLPKDFLSDLVVVIRNEVPRVARNVALQKGATAYLDVTKSSQERAPSAKQSSSPTK